MIETSACQQCGEPAGDGALCARCTANLEQTVHPPFPREPFEDAVQLARGIRSTLREHLAAQPPCPHCAAHPGLLTDVLDAEKAVAEVVVTLEHLAALSREPRARLDASEIEATAEAARRSRSMLEAVVARLAGIAELAREAQAGAGSS